MTERWKQPFDEHLNSVQEEDHGSEGRDFIDAVSDGDVQPSTIGEVKDAIKQLKSNKSFGRDGIGAKLIKMGRTSCRICDTEQLPEEWKDGVSARSTRKETS